MDTYDKNYTLIFNILISCYNNFKEIGTYNHEKNRNSRTNHFTYQTYTRHYIYNNIVLSSSINQPTC